MLSIEEARIAHPTFTFDIPAGATREYGAEAVDRALEAEAMAQEAKVFTRIRRSFSAAWKALTGDKVKASGVEEAL